MFSYFYDRIYLLWMNSCRYTAKLFQQMIYVVLIKFYHLHVCLYKYSSVSHLGLKVEICHWYTMLIIFLCRGVHLCAPLFTDLHLCTSALSLERSRSHCLTYSPILSNIIYVSISTTHGLLLRTPWNYFYLYKCLFTYLLFLN